VGVEVGRGHGNLLVGVIFEVLGLLLLDGLEAFLLGGRLFLLVGLAAELELLLLDLLLLSLELHALEEVHLEPALGPLELDLDELDQVLLGEAQQVDGLLQLPLVAGLELVLQLADQPLLLYLLLLQLVVHLLPHQLQLVLGHLLALVYLDK
jgi:hypothetical protein